MTKEYMLSESQIRDLTSQLTAKDERIAELEGALADSIRWMGRMLARSECDCVELPHTCGRQRVERDLSKIKAVLGDAPKEEPIWSPTAGYGGDAPNEGGGRAMTSPADLEVAAYILRREGRLDDGAYSPEIALERVHQLDGPDKWAIREGGNCMDKTGRWSYERQPSSRTDKWLDSHRFGTVEEALLVWTYSAEGSRRVVEGRP